MLMDSVATVPAGAWAVAVSGGADSVALLRLLHGRPDLSLHIVHLDHETRNGESAVDAQFVADLAGQLGWPYTVARRSEVEATMTKLPKNRSARFRAARMELFGRVVREQNLAGVVLAHHADDQAETILQRLLRGAGPTALAGMAARATVAGLTMLRPLLAVNAADLRQFLRDSGQSWREDSSNASPTYLRNRLRPILSADAVLKENLLRLGGACSAWRDWLRTSAPQLHERFGVDELASLPGPVARQAAGRWLVERGAPADEINRAVCQRLLEMSQDAASPTRQDFPGGVHVCRRRGGIFAESGRGG